MLQSLSAKWARHVLPYAIILLVMTGRTHAQLHLEAPRQEAVVFSRLTTQIALSDVDRPLLVTDSLKTDLVASLREGDAVAICRPKHPHEDRNISL